MPDFTLVNYSPSITAEKNRWLLDYYRVSFSDKRMTLSPQFIWTAIRYIKRYPGGQPYLFNENEGLHFEKLQQVMDHFDPMQPEDKRLRYTLENATEETVFRQASAAIGDEIRSWTYAYIIPDQYLFTNSISAGAPASQKSWINVFYPVVRLLTKKRLDPNGTEQQARFAKLNAAFDHTDALLKDGREFLLGDRLHFLDIAFCVNAAPTVMPPEYGSGNTLPELSDLPEPLKRAVTNFRERPTGRYILNTYKHHRLRP